MTGPNDDNELSTDGNTVPADGHATGGVGEVETTVDGGPTPFESGFDALFATDRRLVALLAPDGTVRRVNDRALSLVGADRTAVRGRPLGATPLVGRSTVSPATAQEWVERCRAGETVAVEVDVVPDDGDDGDGAGVTLEGELRPVETGGRVVNLLATARPVGDGSDADADGRAGTAAGEDDGPAPGRDAVRDRNALRDLHAALADGNLDAVETRRRLLAVGRRRLDAATAFLARVDADDGRLHVESAVGPGPPSAGDELPLPGSYCRATVEREGLHAVPDARDTRWEGTYATTDLGLWSYLGRRIEAGPDDRVVCFVDTEGRRSFSDGEQVVAGAVADWLGELVRRGVADGTAGDGHTGADVAGGYLSLDADGRIARATGRAADLLGLDPAATDRARGDGAGADRRSGSPPSEDGGPGRPGLIGRSLDAVLADGAEACPVRTAVEEATAGGTGATVPASVEGRCPETGRWLAVDAYPDGDGVALFVRDASDRHRRRRRLARYEAVVESGRDMVLLTDGEGTITFVTEALAERLGYDRADLVGAPAALILGEDGLAAAGELLDRIRSAPDTGDAVFETVVDPADGDPFPVEVELSALAADEGAASGDAGASAGGADGLLDGSDDTSGVVAVVRDISELAVTRGKLNDERERFSQLLAGIPDPAAEVEYVGETPVIRAANDAFRETFAGDDPVEGRPVDEVVLPSAEFAPDLDGEAQEIDRRVRAGESVVESVRRETVDGIREFRLRVFPGVTVGGTVRRGLGIYTDVTDRRRRERRLQVIDRVLRHNVRNEMTVVLGNADYLRSALPEAGDDGEWATDLDLGTLETIVEDLHGSARSVAELSRKAREGQRALERTAGGPVDLTSVVDRVLVDHRRDGAEVTAHLPDRAPVAAGPGVRGAVDNLVENALLHGAPPVEVSVETGPDAVTLGVADRGPGIPETERAVLDGETDPTQLEHGSGLGLWIVRWVVEACGGEVTVADRPGGGAVVTVELRRADGDAVPTIAGGEDVAADGAGGGADRDGPGD